MAKITLTFDLPDEQDEYDDACHGDRWRHIVQDMERHLRDCAKYGSSYHDVHEALVQLREKLYDLADEKGLHLD